MSSITMRNQLDPKTDSHILTIVIPNHVLVKHRSSLMPAALYSPPSQGMGIIEDTVLDVLSACWGGSEPEQPAPQAGVGGEESR